MSELRKWAVEVKLRDGCCVHCGAVDMLEAHHVYPRGRYPDLATHPMNGLTLCRGCHRWAHGSTLAFREWFRTAFPQRLAVLRSLSGIGWGK